MKYDRKNETCPECHQKLVQGSSASWCPESHKPDTDHTYSVEHSLNDEVVGKTLLVGRDLYWHNMAVKASQSTLDPEEAKK
jgi:hypothetical protein